MMIGGVKKVKSHGRASSLGSGCELLLVAESRETVDAFSIRGVSHSVDQLSQVRLSR